MSKKNTKKKKPSNKFQVSDSVVMTAYECNLLLYAFDDFYGIDNEGHVRDTRGVGSLPTLQNIRDKLFDAHDHDPNM